MLEEQETSFVSTVALAGLESVGKSALFRHLTGEHTGVETNVKGSTVTISEGRMIRNSNIKIIDTPGIKFKDDSVTTQTAVDQAGKLQKLILVVKASSVKGDLLTLDKQLDLKGKDIIVVATHRDKCPPREEDAHFIQRLLNVPVIWCNSRSLIEEEHSLIWHAIQQASPWNLNRNLLSFLPADTEETNASALERLLARPYAGPAVAFIMMIGMFAGPVLAAYLFSSYLQPITEKLLLSPLIDNMAVLPELLQVLLIGDYGILTLGWYSFLWAFPVVVLIGISIAVTEETGVQEHITSALHPWMTKIGLTGRDLMPVLTGFGCNVVAVMQSRSCSSCTRGACMSMISFGSACSYQIGASLSLFGSAGHPLLLLPYIIVLVLVGAVHTRIWHHRDALSTNPLSSLPYLQTVTWRGVKFRLTGILKQFLTQAMPIFIVVCLFASLLQYAGIMKAIIALIAPLLTLFSLPAEAAPGVTFSFFRKDGMMVLNEGQGELLQTMEVWQVFIIVYLASTLSSCLVTLFSIYREMGIKQAGQVLGRQMLTSVISALSLALLLTFLFKGSG